MQFDHERSLAQGCVENGMQVMVTQVTQTHGRMTNLRGRHCGSILSKSSAIWRENVQANSSPALLPCWQCCTYATQLGVDLQRKVPGLLGMQASFG